jgi:hypothetical protein
MRRIRRLVLTGLIAATVTLGVGAVRAPGADAYCMPNPLYPDIGGQCLNICPRGFNCLD